MIERFYSYDEIYQKTNCHDFAKSYLGWQQGRNGRFNVSWRPEADDFNCEINDKGFHDHKTKESGGIIKLLAQAKNITDQEAQQIIGDYYNLEPKIHLKKGWVKPSEKYDQLLAEGYKVTKVYDYRDLEGNIIHSTVRLECPGKKKEFLQRTPKHWGLGEITPIPYNLSGIINAPGIIYVEGEKDADALIALGLPATTTPMGAEKWQNTYNQYFKGKPLVILRDNDVPGYNHSIKIANELYDIVKNIKISITSEKPKGDVYDYLEEGHSKKDIVNIIKETSYINRDELLNDYTIAEAKKANQIDFCNFIERPIRVNGKVKKERESRSLQELIKDIHRRFLGFPVVIGDTLMDYNRDTGLFHPLWDSTTLFAWIQLRSKRKVHWGKVEKGVSKEELFRGLSLYGNKYSGLSYMPDYPKHPEVIYAPIKLPEPSENFQYFEKLIEFFNPHTDKDRILIKTLFAAPLYDPTAPRPLWVIDAVGGQSSGKSTLAQLVAMLYGKDGLSKSCLQIEYDELKNSDNNLIKRLVSSGAMLKKIVLIDNVDSNLKSPFLASITTSDTISGRQVFGKNECSVLNRFTYVITVNSASVDTDISTRAFFINLAPSNKTKQWRYKVKEFIDKYQLQIIADILGKLKSCKKDFAPVSRFPEFEADVLTAMCDDFDQYNEVSKHIQNQAAEADYTIEDAREIEETIKTNLINLNVDIDKENVFIRSAVFEKWFPKFGKYPTRIIKNHIKTGKIAKVDLSRTKDNRDRRGLFYLTDVDYPHKYKVIDVSTGSVKVLYDI